MQKRTLGKSNLEVSVIGFGGIPIQRVDENMAIELIKEAHNQGINFIDTARGYNQSEALLGKALSQVGRDKFILATKTMRRDYDGMWEDIRTSLSNLQTDYIDLYQMHNIRTVPDLERVMKDDGAMRALKEAKEQGLIRSIGITSHSVDLLFKAIEIEDFETIQYPYNAVERQAEELFKKAKDMNIGVIVMKPLAGGAITNGELSLRFVVDNPSVTVAIPGMDTLEQVRGNASVGIDVRKLTDEESKVLFEEANSLGSKFCRRCGYCAPCPQGIDIPMQFLMEGYYTRYDLKEWAMSRYGSLEKKSSDCVECGICESRCPYDLPIRDMLKNVVAKLEK